MGPRLVAATLGDPAAPRGALRAKTAAATCAAASTPTPLALRATVAAEAREAASAASWTWVRKRETCARSAATAIARTIKGAAVAQATEAPPSQAGGLSQCGRRPVSDAVRVLTIDIPGPQIPIQARIGSVAFQLIDIGIEKLMYTIDDIVQVEIIHGTSWLLSKY
jgi:hypothetical protein